VLVESPLAGKITTYFLGQIMRVLSVNHHFPWENHNFDWLNMVKLPHVLWVNAPFSMVNTWVAHAGKQHQPMPRIVVQLYTYQVRWVSQIGKFPGKHGEIMGSNTLW
jgi:membrane protein YqaA with SNARE-associated domain